MIEIPWQKLGIPDDIRARVDPSAPREERLAFARQDGAGSAEVRAAALYVLATYGDAALREEAVAALKRVKGLAPAITQRAHPKVLELIAEVVDDRDALVRVLQVRNANDRTGILLARRADATLCDEIADNHERLLITPEILVALHANPNCSEDALERAIGFLRMNQSLPELPATRGAPPPAPAFDLEAEVAAALAGQASPHLEARKKLEMFELDRTSGPLEGFEFDFTDAEEFSLDLLEDRPAGASAVDDGGRSIEKKIAAMTVGKKIKLAYLGNKEVRGILIRDRSRMVAAAVVRSGRLSDSEVQAYAGNRNLHADVLREIAMNKEWMRKYPLQVALVNNPRCPPSVGIGLVSRMQAKELDALARNRNVSSVVFQLAGKLQRERKKGR